MRSTDRKTRGGHLSRVELARLVDEPASEDERRHLETCAECMEELAALVAQSRALAGMPLLRPAAEDWVALEARLAEEGLIGAPASASVSSAATVPSESASRVGHPLVGAAPSSLEAVVRHRPRWGRGWLQAAAGLALFVAGGGAGTYVAQRGVAAEPAAGVTAENDGSASVTPAGSEPSLQQSENLVRQAENLYLQALVDYRDQVDRTDASLRPRDPVGRLVVLENLLAASEAAVREDPADPFFNGLLVNTAAEHRAALEAITSVNTVSW